MRLAAAPRVPSQGPNFPPSLQFPSETPVLPHEIRIPGRLAGCPSARPGLSRHGAPLRRTVREDRAEDHEGDPSQRPSDEADEEEAEEEVDHREQPVAEHHQDSSRDVAGVDVADSEGLEEDPGQQFQHDRHAGIGSTRMMVVDFADRR